MFYKIINPKSPHPTLSIHIPESRVTHVFCPKLGKSLKNRHLASKGQVQFLFISTSEFRTFDMLATVVRTVPGPDVYSFYLHKLSTCPFQPNRNPNKIPTLSPSCYFIFINKLHDQNFLIVKIWSPKVQGLILNSGPIPVPALSKACVCGSQPTRIAGSNPARSIDICLLWVLCCRVEVSALCRSLVQRSTTECDASLCVL